MKKKGKKIWPGQGLYKLNNLKLYWCQPQIISIPVQTYAWPDNITTETGSILQ